MKPTISRIGIGTVQFGMSYGINNSTGQVTHDDVVEILRLAADHGVNFLDTARGYGESEAAIGRALEETGLRDSFIICTKLDLPSDYASFTEGELADAAEKSIEESRKALRSETLDVVLLHTPGYRHVGGGIVWKYLTELHARGTIARLGVSAGIGPDDLDPFFGDGITSFMQIPFNPLDGRWAKAGVFQRSRKEKITMVNRSTLLQGLLLMEAGQVEERLPFAVEYHRKWIDLCRNAGIKPFELAMRYATTAKEIDCTVLGVDTAAQFEENLAFLSATPLDDDLIRTIRDTFSGTPENVVYPRRWDEYWGKV